MKYYPLTAAQNMHHQWIMEYGTQQVSGVSIVASLKAPLDFKLLKKCILLEYERYGCMRLQFTKPDKNGNVKQYQVKETKDTVEYYDLRGEGTPDYQNHCFHQKNCPAGFDPVVRLFPVGLNYYHSLQSIYRRKR